MRTCIECLISFASYLVRFYILFHYDRELICVEKDIAFYFLFNMS